MKQLLSFVFLFAISVFFSCNNENPITPINPGSFQGEWTVDKVQMVQAPSGGGVSAIMKQALVPFGEVSGSFAGYLDFKFGAETMTSSSTNLIQGESYFIGDIGYYSSGSLLYKSIDGGNTWSSITLPASTGYSWVCVYNQTTIYLMSSNMGNNVLSKSTNSGTNWSIINNNVGFFPAFGISPYSSMCFVNDAVGYAVSVNSIYKTTNGGVNWNNITSGSLTQNIMVKFYSESRGIMQVINPNGDFAFRKTNDGGISWTEHYVSKNLRINHSFFLNENIAWVCGYDQSSSNPKYYMYKTVDGAQTWNLVSDIIPFHQVKFVNENIGYGLTADGFLIKTINGGSSWSTYSTPADQTFYYNLNIFNEQLAVYTPGKFWKPSGIIDTTKWTANGMITNSAIKLITDAYSLELRANGDFSINSNNIVFTVYNYLNTHNKVGTGTFSFADGFLYIDLNLPNDEKWKIKLRRK